MTSSSSYVFTKTPILRQMFSERDLRRLRNYLDELDSRYPLYFEERSPREVAFEMLEDWLEDDKNASEDALYKVELLPLFRVYGDFPEQAEQDFMFAGFLLW